MARTLALTLSMVSEDWEEGGQGEDGPRSACRLSIETDDGATTMDVPRPQG